MDTVHCIIETVDWSQRPFDKDEIILQSGMERNWAICCLFIHKLTPFHEWFRLTKLPKAQRTRGLSSAHQSNLCTCVGHITSSNTNLDQISSSESWPSINFKISTKRQHLDYKTLDSKYWPNLVSKSRQIFNFITSTKHQKQNTDQIPASKYCLIFNFKILTKLTRVANDRTRVR